MKKGPTSSVEVMPQRTGIYCKFSEHETTQQRIRKPHIDETQEKVIVKTSFTGGRSIRTKQSQMPHPKHAWFLLFNEESLQLLVLRFEGRLNTFLDANIGNRTFQRGLG